MVLHTVVLRFENMEDLAIAKKQLESLRGKVPNILDIDVEVYDNDLCLLTRHVDTDALEAYQNDIYHIRVKEFLGQLGCERKSVDFQSV